jgi:hypothetical protein
MKRILIFGMGVLLWASINSHAAQTAQARLFCLSVRFQQGIYRGLIGDVTLDLSTINRANLGDPATLKNGELAPTFSVSEPDHFSGFVLYDTLLDDVVLVGEIDLDTPAFTDVNGNGFDDFFEVSEAGAGASTGTYASFVGSGPIRATWSRAAGSKDGTYALAFGSGQTSLGTYQGAFEILEYAGPLNYTTDSNKVSGAVNLLQTGAPDNVLAGPIEFTKSPTKRFDELNLKHGVWTNASAHRFNISNDIDSFLRDTFLKTNYFGNVDFDDGDPNTSDTDYRFWFLSIDDVNDSDNDGIPDFSDDPGSGTVRRPTVLLSLGNTNLSFSISSTVGRTVEIQEISSLSQTNWAPVSSFSPTNDPQVVTLPRPTEGTKFWRVRVL